MRSSTGWPLAASSPRPHLLADWSTSGAIGSTSRAPEKVLPPHAGWLRLFGGNESVIGQPVTLGTSTFDIVGVLPRGFVFPSVFARRPDLIVLREPLRRSATGGTLHAVARLAPGVSRSQAQAEIDAATSAIAAVTNGPDSGPVLDDVRSLLYPIGRPVMRYLLLATRLILLLGCATLSNMLLVRGRRSLHETALRLAFGATRLRLVRPMVFEALLVGPAGALLAACFTFVAFDALLGQVPPAVYGAAPVGVDLRILMLSLLMGLGSAMVFGVVPAWRAAGIDVLALMRRRGGRGGRARLGRPMLAAQVAIALAVVFGAAVAARAFVALIQTPLGFSADRVLRHPHDATARRGGSAAVLRARGRRPRRSSRCRGRRRFRDDAVW